MTGGLKYSGYSHLKFEKEVIFRLFCIIYEILKKKK